MQHCPDLEQELAKTDEKGGQIQLVHNLRPRKVRSVFDSLEKIAEVTMVWLAFDMSIALSCLVLLGFGRWLFDLAQRPQANHRRID